MADFEQTSATIRVTAPKGITPYTAEEIRNLGYSVKKTTDSGVELKGTLLDCIHLNMRLHTAHKVLFTIQRIDAPNPDVLYREVKRLPWEDYLKANGYFSIDNFVRNDHILDTRYASLKTKDAIVDRFYEKTGKRPSSGADKRHANLFLFWKEDQATLFLDTSGETLAKHGYRVKSGPAPLAEPLASGIVKATGWDKQSPFVNPMCGTGTLAIEAALMALKRPPGLFRENYGFMHLKGYRSQYFDEVRQAIKSQMLREIPCKIIASDHDDKALKAAEANARKAGVLKFIRFRKCKFSETPIPEKPGICIMNPEYGERMGEEEGLQDTYTQIGDFFKQQCKGYQGFVFTGNLELAKAIGLKTQSRTPFYNGKLECRLLGFDLY